MGVNITVAILRYTQFSGWSGMLRLAEAFGILGVKSWDLSYKSLCKSSFSLISSSERIHIVGKPQSLNHYSVITHWLIPIAHLVYLIVWLNGAIWSSGIWVSTYHLLPNNPCPLRVILLHNNPIQYFIIYFSINPGMVLLWFPFNYFIYMEFFLLFLSKFFSSYSLGMVRVNVL